MQRAEFGSVNLADQVEMHIDARAITPCVVLLIGPFQHHPSGLLVVFSLAAKHQG